MTAAVEVSTVHACQEEIESYLRLFWYSARRRVLPPHVGTLVKCDCGLLFQLQPDGTWLEGEWNWAALSSGSVSALPVAA